MHGGLDATVMLLALDQSRYSFSTFLTQIGLTNARAMSELTT
jgi:hypothetical protein